MNSANESLRTARFTIYGEERLRDGKILVTERLVKLNVRPKKVYFYSVTPDPGMEVLWTENSADGKMLIKPSSFPYVTFSLKPGSSLARTDSHHHISEMGFDYSVSLINHYLKTHGESLLRYARIRDTVNWQGKRCIHLVMDFPSFAYSDYTVKKGENISTIAAKLRVNDYMIMCANGSTNDMYDVKEGQVIKVPNFYAAKIEFYIDLKTWLPVRQVIYDDKGLFENFEFRNLVVNPVFKEEEFTSDYKDYKF